MLKAVTLIFLAILTYQASSFTVSQQIVGPYKLAQRCVDVLPFEPVDINYDYYYTWYGKVGTNINGTTFDNGHVFTRHLAVNYQCTADQKNQNKTVFYDEYQFYKTLIRDTTNCDMNSSKEFTFSQDYVIPSPDNYIKGIDCKTGEVRLFSSYFVQYKRAIQNPKPTSSQYMASMKATIWTFYPKR